MTVACSIGKSVPFLFGFDELVHIRSAALVEIILGCSLHVADDAPSLRERMSSKKHVTNL